MPRFAKYAAQKKFLDEEVQKISKRHPNIPGSNSSSIVLVILNQPSPALMPINWSQEMKADLINIFYTGDKLEARIEGCKSTLASYFKDKLFELLKSNVPEDQIQYAVEARNGPLKFTRLNTKRENARSKRELPPAKVATDHFPQRVLKDTKPVEQRNAHPDPLGQLLVCNKRIL